MVYPSIFGVLVLILDVIALVSLLGGSSTPGHKALWTILILLLPVLGMALYFLIGQSPRDAKVI